MSKYFETQPVAIYFSAGNYRGQIIKVEDKADRHGAPQIILGVKILESDNSKIPAGAVVSKVFKYANVPTNIAPRRELWFLAGAILGVEAEDTAAMTLAIDKADPTPEWWLKQVGKTIAVEVVERETKKGGVWTDCNFKLDKKAKAA